MKKIIAAFSLMLISAAGAYAQNANSSAQQTLNLNMSDAIDMSFTGSGTATGTTLNLAFNNVNDFANGVESGTQEIKIRSNKNYNVSCKSNASTFTYAGAASPAPTMSVWNTLSCMVASNATGGTIPMPWSMTSWYSVTSVATNMITNGTRGGDQKFAVKYKAAPGFSFPAGTYTVDVVFTATQP